MVCAAWCTESLLQGVVTIGQSTPDHKRDHCGRVDLLPWLLPLTLSSLLKKDPWLQIRGKVIETKVEFFIFVFLFMSMVLFVKQNLRAHREKPVTLISAPSVLRCSIGFCH